MVVVVDTVAISSDAGFELDVTCISDVRDPMANSGTGLEVLTNALLLWSFFSLKCKVEDKTRFIKVVLIFLSEVTESKRTVEVSDNTRTYKELEATNDVADDSIVTVRLLTAATVKSTGCFGNELANGSIWLVVTIPIISELDCGDFDGSKRFLESELFSMQLVVATTFCTELNWGEFDGSMRCLDVELFREFIRLAVGIKVVDRLNCEDGEEGIFCSDHEFVKEAKTIDVVSASCGELVCGDIDDTMCSSGELVEDSETLVMAFTFSVGLNFGNTDNKICLPDNDLLKEVLTLLVASTLSVEVNCEEINDKVCSVEDELLKEYRMLVGTSAFSDSRECEKINDTLCCLDGGIVKEYDRLVVACPITEE